MIPTTLITIGKGISIILPLIVSPAFIYIVPAGIVGYAAYNYIKNGMDEPSAKILHIHEYRKMLQERHTAFWEKIKLHYEKNGDISSFTNEINNYNKNISDYNKDKKWIADALERYYGIKKNPMTPDLKIPEEMSVYNKIKLIIEDCYKNTNNLYSVEQALLRAEGKGGMILDNTMEIQNLETFLLNVNIATIVILAILSIISYWRKR